MPDYAAEFSELSVRREPAGPSRACTPCRLPLRVRRARIPERLSSGQHCRSRRLLRQLGLPLPRGCGGIFYNAAVHDLDIISLLLGESVPDTVFSLGHAFCADMACLGDVDTVTISMEFPRGAIVTLDVSQHCTRSWREITDGKNDEEQKRIGKSVHAVLQKDGIYTMAFQLVSCMQEIQRRKKTEF